MMNSIRIARTLVVSSAVVFSLFNSTCNAALASPFTYTPDLQHNAVALEGLIPVKQFMNVPLPKGSIEFEDGSLAVNIIPNWNFDRVPVLQGPIIRTDVTTNGREAVVNGIVLFTAGYWYDKYWTPGSRETVVTKSGTTTTGKITDMNANSLTVTPEGGGAAVMIPLSDIQAIQSPRAYSFTVPALAPAAVTPDISWTADVQNVSLAPSIGPDAAPSVAMVRRDPLLNMKDEGDWSNRKMFTIGTLLSLAQLSQFTPELVTALYSHKVWQHFNRSAYGQAQTVGIFGAPLIPPGNTYSFIHNH